jgi:TetR/AcrR family transcriptional repressor of nem operon
VCREALATALLDWRNDICKVLRQAQAQGLVRADMSAETLSDMLINTWEGAVIRMKLERSLAPLQQCLQLLLDGYFRS